MYPSIHLSIYLSICISFYLSIHTLSIHGSIHPSIHPSIHASMHTSICVSASAYVSLFGSPGVRVRSTEELRRADTSPDRRSFAAARGAIGFTWIVHPRRSEFLTCHRISTQKGWGPSGWVPDSAVPDPVAVPSCKDRNIFAGGLSYSNH